MQGPRPTPTHLRLLRGGRIRNRKNKAEPKPSGELQDPPAGLPHQAVPFWQRAIESAPAGLLKRLDTSVLRIWAVAAWLHDDAARHVETEGSLLRGKEGGPYQNPAVSILNRQAMIMMRAASEMGFTPASRTRVAIEPGGRDGDDFGEFQR